MAATREQARSGPALPPNPAGLNLAAGWYVALDARRLRGKPVPLTLFGRPLVAWRGRGGQPVIMPRFCPHMGASLALGRVTDGQLRCPFHGWTFGTDGVCAAIPGVTRIPATARSAPYPVLERYGFVWAWYGGPEPLYELPRFAPLETDRRHYTGFRFNDPTTGTARQLLENGVDYFHFSTLHGLELDQARFTVLHDQADAADNGPPITPEAWFGAIFEGTVPTWNPRAHPLRWAQAAVSTFGLGDGFRLLVDGWPGGQRFTTYIDGREVSKVYMGITPTGPYQTSQRGWAMVRNGNQRWKTALLAALFYLQNRGGTMQDIPIYNTSGTWRNGTLVRYDNGVIRFRRYYQEWVGRAHAGGSP